MKAFKAFFLSRLLREKILMLAFVLIGAAIWLSSVSDRVGVRWRAIRQTSTDLDVQQRWLVQRARIEKEAQLAIAHLHRSFPRHLTWRALSKSSHLLGDNIAQHTAILEAIERRDPAEARRQMSAHLHEAGELVAVLLERSV